MVNTQVHGEGFIFGMNRECILSVFKTLGGLHRKMTIDRSIPMVLILRFSCVGPMGAATNEEAEAERTKPCLTNELALFRSVHFFPLI